MFACSLVRSQGATKAAAAACPDDVAAAAAALLLLLLLLLLLWGIACKRAIAGGDGASGVTAQGRDKERTIMSVQKQVLSVKNSIPRRQVRWNHFVCRSTIPRGNVTCDGEREKGTYVGISVTHRQIHGRRLEIWEGYLLKPEQNP